MDNLMNTLGKQAKRAAQQLSQLESLQKNHVLIQMAQDLEEQSAALLSANQQDLDRAKDHGIPDPMIDRLRLTPERINEMAEGIRQVAQLPDPIGVVEKM